MTSPIEHPHVTLIHDFFDAFGKGDTSRLSTMMKTEIVWHMPGNSPISGDWQGIDGIMNGIRANAMRLGNGTYGFEVLQVFGNDDYAISIHRDYYTGDDNHFDLRFVIYYKMEDGKIAEIWEIPFDLYESDRFFNQQEAMLTGA